MLCTTSYTNYFVVLLSDALSISSSLFYCVTNIVSIHGWSNT